MQPVRDGLMDRCVYMLPAVIMAESFAAAVVMAAVGRWGQAVYWAAAGLLNFSVVFLIPKGW